MEKINIETFLIDDVYNVKSYKRVKEAIRLKDSAIVDVAHNVVDSVIYIKNKTIKNEEIFVGRKNLRAFCAYDGQMTIGYQNINLLKQVKEYDDLLDRSFYEGKLEEVVLKKGEIVLFDLDEASKIINVDSNEYYEFYISKDGGIK